MTTRFPVAVDDPLRTAGWQPGRWDIRQAEQWADTLRAHLSPAGHRHAVFPAAVEVWAEFGTLHINPTGPGRHIAPAAVHIDPLPGLHAARTLSDLGRALGTEICPLGTEGEGEALLVIDAERRVYSLDPTGDWYLGPDFDTALSALLMGLTPARLSVHSPDPAPVPHQEPGQAPSRDPGQTAGQTPGHDPGQAPSRDPGQAHAQDPGHWPAQHSGQPGAEESQLTDARTE